MIEAKGSSSNFFSRVFDTLYPRKCGLCGDWSERAICPTCEGTFERVEQPFERFFDGGSLDYRAAIFRYEGRAAQAVRRLKYSRITPLIEFMAEEIAEAVKTLGLSQVDIFVPIPIHWTRRVRRGFNQAELLCEELSQEQVAPDTILLRTRATRPQVGLTREQRLINLQDAFAAKPNVAGKHVLLIDDVVTTLGTARECSKALKHAGAAEVGILAFCGDTDRTDNWR